MRKAKFNNRKKQADKIQSLTENHRVKTDKIKAMTPIIAEVYGKEKAEWLEKERISIKETALDLRKEGVFVSQAIISLEDKTSNVIILPKAQCKGIKGNGVRSISAIMYDRGNDVDFVGTIASREDGSYIAFTMELPKMGEYSHEPLIYPSIDELVWEREHWIAGIVDYAKEHNISFEWKEFWNAWKKWDSQSMRTKASKYKVQISF